MTLHIRGLPRSGTTATRELLRAFYDDVDGGNRHHFLPDDIDGPIVHAVKHPLAWVASVRHYADLPYGTCDDDRIDFLLSHQWLTHNHNVDHHSHATARHHDVLTEPEEVVGEVAKSTNRSVEGDVPEMGRLLNDPNDRWESYGEMREYYIEEKYVDDVNTHRIRQCFKSDTSQELCSRLGIEVGI